ncbi:MAG: ATP-dependent protease ATPase subunit HslU [Holosporales bacterium]|jgi:ATP-dependent HslUV protease ATP-binding subunit HslU|nr:ATP-dependent protease ATPase subunit HslU [Holosporales bacterium]
MIPELTPREIVNGLDRYIVGQKEAKKSVAVAVRNRWRRMSLPKNVRDEIAPRNILMVGPTGVGKTEIARRLAKMVNSPFLKVEATKFTEVGYVGRDVEQIIRDLVDIAMNMVKKSNSETKREHAVKIAKDRVVDIIAGADSSPETKKKFLDKLNDSEFTSKEIEVELSEAPTSQFPTFDLQGSASIGMINISDMFGKAFGGSNKKLRKIKISEAVEAIANEEIDKLLDHDQLVHDAIKLAENNGIVFIDEIDKICCRDGSHKGGEVSREGVQRDLLPIVEGTTVTTKYGLVKTDFILFIASGSFHMSSPSDLLPELQGRFPINVKLDPLTKEDFFRILTEPEMNLIKQEKTMLSIEGLDVVFEKEAIEEIANIAYMINTDVENLGARRLNTIIWKVLNDLSFNAPELGRQTINITKQYVIDNVDNIAHDVDLSRFLL